ncbi:MAG: Nif3-like dinuclear metal center hexameric protein [Nitrospiraceae bacterium]|nr:Nif3-like dinuclear metal center hexameric protein [Nitrospiraceae bacterium]
MKRSSISLKKLVSFLDSELSLSEFPKDDSANGLQVEGRERVGKVGLAVDACGYTFERAKERGVDFLLVHHGLIWGGLKSIRGVAGKRIKALLDSGISLYACHLPLDWHPRYGNNAELLRVLSLKKMGEFGEYHGKRIGYWGKTGTAMQMDVFVKFVDKTLKTRSSYVDFKKKVRNVGVVSGGGWSAIHDAEELGIDTFLTGEPSHSAYHLAKEMGVNLIFAGHYATETLGVKAVGEMLKKKLGLAVEFIDHPTGL